MAQQQERSTGNNLLRQDVGVGLGAGSALAASHADELPATKVSSPGKDAWRRFQSNWAAMISLTILLLLIFAAVFAPWLHTVDPTASDFSIPTHAPPSAAHWFGTDGGGYDQYSRTLYGMRIPFIVGLIGTLISTVLGSLLGVMAGYAGGWVDSILSRFTDLIFAFPAFLLAVLCAEFFGTLLDNSVINNYLAGGGRVFILTIVFAAVGWPFLMRFVRSLALSIKEQQFVEAARTSGSTSWRILVRHLLPNMWGLILVQASFLVVGFITTEAVLSILGLGVKPPNPDLGVMLFVGQQDLSYTYWEVFFPSVVITILILAFTFLGDGIRDAIDPRGKK